MWVFKKRCNSDKQVTWNLIRGLFNSCDQCYRLSFLLVSCFRYACKQMIKKKDIVYFNRNDLPPWSCCIKYNLLLEILADVCWTCVVKAIVCVFRFFLVVANGMAVKKKIKRKKNVYFNRNDLPSHSCTYFHYWCCYWIRHS